MRSNYLVLGSAGAGRHPLLEQQWGTTACPCAKQEGWGYTCLHTPRKVTNQIGPHLHRCGVSRRVKRIQKCPTGAVFSLQRHVTSGGEAFYPLAPNFRAKSTLKIIQTNLLIYRRENWDSTRWEWLGARAELRPGYGVRLLDLCPFVVWSEAGRVVSTCLPWAMNISSQVHPQQTLSVGDLHHTDLATPFSWLNISWINEMRCIQASSALINCSMYNKSSIHSLY